MTLTVPTLWTPRAGPWWRLPRFTLDDLTRFAKLQRGSDGKLRRKDNKVTGHVAGGTSPCCCSAPVTCAVCPDSEGPASYTAEISGVTICTVCMYSGSLPTVKYAGSIDGTYDAPFSGGSATVCEWNNGGSGAPIAGLTVKTYSGLSCTGTETTQTNAVRIRIRKTGTTLCVSAVGYGPGLFFDAIQTISTCREGPYVFTNILTGTCTYGPSATYCGSTFNGAFLAGYGGTITLTPN